MLPLYSTFNLGLLIKTFHFFLGPKKVLHNFSNPRPPPSLLPCYEKSALKDLNQSGTQFEQLGAGTRQIVRQAGAELGQAQLTN